MPNRIETLAERAGDVTGVTGSALAATGFADVFGYIELGFGAVAAIIGVVAVIYSGLYNRERWIKLKKERKDG